MKLTLKSVIIARKFGLVVCDKLQTLKEVGVSSIQ